MFSKKRGVTETSQIVQANCFWFRWLVALGSQSVYGRVDSLIPPLMVRSLWWVMGGQRPITPER